MGEATFTFRVDDELKSEFGAAAKAQDRTGAQLLRDYMREVVRKQKDEADYDAWFRRQVQIGIEASEAGHVISNEKAEARMAPLRADALRRIRDSTS